MEKDIFKKSMRTVFKYLRKRHKEEYGLEEFGLKELSVKSGIRVSTIGSYESEARIIRVPEQNLAKIAEVYDLHAYHIHLLVEIVMNGDSLDQVYNEIRQAQKDLEKLYITRYCIKPKIQTLEVSEELFHMIKHMSDK